MNTKTLSLLGSILLFIGLFTIMIPEIPQLSDHSHNPSEITNYSHHDNDKRFLGLPIYPSTLYGAIMTILAISLIEYSSKKKKQTS